jgi:hypothetical protein
VRIDPDNQQSLKVAGIAYPSCYLLRPDGHIALAGVPLDTQIIEANFAEHHLRGMVDESAT